MNILYYLPVELEMDDPLFRLGTFKNILMPEIRGLLDATQASESPVQVAMVVRHSVLKAARDQDLLDARVRWFEAESGEVIDDAAWYRGEADEAQVSRRASACRALVKDFAPDLVLVYEKPAAFLAQAFPQACIVNVMFGAFSRAPFPTLGSYDPLGLFGQSFIARHAEAIRSRALPAPEIAMLREIRRSCAQALAQYQPFKREIAEIRQKFRRTILVACQVDGHVAVTGTSAAVSQADMVRDVLEQVPGDVGVVVTQHAYRTAIDAEQAAALADAYPNFVLFDNTARVPDASQFLLPYMDALVTVSSSLAFQGALWQVPVVAMGASHIAPVASAHGASAIEPLLAAPREAAEVLAVEQALGFVLFRYNVQYRSTVFRGAAYAQHLRELVASLRTDPAGIEYFFERHIDYDAAARELAESFTAYKLRSWFDMRAMKPATDYLLAELATHRVASFDLFDTLLQRPLLEPHEAFLVMEPAARAYLRNRNFAFHRLRRDAEADVRRPTGGEYEITLEDIYRRLAELAGITQAQATHLMGIELDVERALCCVKPEMMVYFRLAQLLCNRVGVVSDFYIERDFVAGLLEKNGIVADFLYVSATSKTRKHNGSIFPAILRDLAREGFTASDIVHIGDNQIADKTMPQMHGIAGYHLPKATDNFKRSVLGEVFGPAVRTSGLASSIVIGLVANRFFGVPWNQVDTTSSFRGDPFLLGYAGYGPLIVGFCQWLHRERLNKGYEALYFLARDGWIVKTVYERLYGESADNVYMYSSRRAATVASLRTIEEIVELAWQSFGPQPLSSLMLNRFGLEVTDAHREALHRCALRADSMISQAADMQRLVAFLHEVGGEILTNAASEREAYVRYLEEIGFADRVRSGRVALVDIGYSGTMQHYLMRILPGTRMAGLYMLTHHHARNDFLDVDFAGWLASLDDHRIAYRHKLNDHVFIFESGLSSPEGSLLRFSLDEAGGSVRESIHASAEDSRRQMLSRVHRGIEEFGRDYRRNLDGAIDVVALSPMLAGHALLAFADAPTGKDAAIFYGCEVENVFGGGSVCLIEPAQNLPGKGAARDARVAELVKRSKWKQGARAYYATDNASAAKPAAVPAVVPLIETSAPEAPRTAQRHRKLAKLINNPYAFFNDSRIGALVPLKHVFGAHTIGRTNRALLKKALS